MKSTLEQLWNGRITPWENCGSNDPEVKEMIKLLSKNREALDNALNPQQKQMLERYLTCRDEYLYLLNVHAFSDGFSLASRLLSEAMRG